MKELFQKHKEYFASDITREYSFRIRQLRKLYTLVNENESQIAQALHNDLHKSSFESYMTETSQVLQEILYVMKNLESWMKPVKVKTPKMHLPARSFISSEPLGSVLIISPWNYPFQLTLSPLIGAIGAGNTVILKPSEYATHTSKLIKTLLSEYFDESYISVAEGGVDVSEELLDLPFDHIFYTGSTHIGKIIMQKASKNLVPFTLELGGKSPCIVDHQTNIAVTARRIVWGKFINAGQTCTAPDYVLVDASIKDTLVDAMKKTVQNFYTVDPKVSPDYSRIINDRQFDRLKKYLAEGTCVIGGQTEKSSRYIAPTILENVSLSSTVMTEEIFGPILPVIAYNSLDEALQIVNTLTKPLVVYFFSTDKSKQDQVIKTTSSGAVCINDTIIHLTVPELPFGGVGMSGMGRYHGKASYDCFSNKKSVFKRFFIADLTLRYPPSEGKLKKLKWIMKYFSG